jgi:hypothetical protein
VELRARLDVLEKQYKCRRMDGEVGVTNNTVSVPIDRVDEVLAWDEYVTKAKVGLGLAAGSRCCRLARLVVAIAF